MTAAEKQKMRKIYILPNLFTAFNLFLGVLAIFHVYLEVVNPIVSPGEWSHLTKACWFIIIAGVLDGFDGAVARLTHTESDFGMQFDSLSDMVSFGVAPSVVAFHMLSTMYGNSSRFLLTICALFALCGALRLARYNVQSPSSDHKGFFGLPIPCAAGGLAIFVLMMIDKNFGLLTTYADYHGLPVAKILSVFFPFLVIMLALLMVSEVPYASLAKQLRLSREMSFETLRTIVFIIAVVWGLQSDETVLLVLLGGYFYILYFPVVAIWKTVSGKVHPVPVTAGHTPPSDDKR